MFQGLSHLSQKLAKGRRRLNVATPALRLPSPPGQQHSERGLESTPDAYTSQVGELVGRQPPARPGPACSDSRPDEEGEAAFGLHRSSGERGKGAADIET